MKLTDIKTLHEIDDEDRKEPPPITGGETISTSQAAKVLNVSVSRVRQLIGDGHLKPIIKPRKGDRDHELRLKDVQSLKDNLPKKGRPFKGKTSDTKDEPGKDKEESKKDDE